MGVNSRPWVSSSCSTRGTRRVILVYPVISHEWGKNIIAIPSKGTYRLSFVAHIFSHLWHIYSVFSGTYIQSFVAHIFSHLWHIYSVICGTYIQSFVAHIFSDGQPSHGGDCKTFCHHHNHQSWNCGKSCCGTSI